MEMLSALVASKQSPPGSDFKKHNGRPYCHKPCYGALFGPRGVNIGGVGSYLYNPPTPSPASITPLNPSSFSPPRPRTGLLHGKKSVNIGDVGCYIYDPVEIKPK
ncbi:Cysteine-rich protein 3 [Sciurus carolinensis]|uniref:Cysteine-rich protein 3 n=1 Tax=Sciurus carolinensis TaxID=30640 RepID=A0AA41ME07_SCICA|nr:Cysteine-rich protein 3 [Sciurus carolinensis]